MGKMLDSRGPGLIIILPMLDDAKTVDMRIKTSEVPHLTCITQDNIQVEVDFVFLWKIKEPTKSISQVKESEESIRLLASAILRTVIAQFVFDDVINKRDSINDMLKNNINKTCEEWGILITKMELREIKPPDDILQAMHRRREADWNSQATVKNAEAQAEALRLLSEIAKAVDENTMNLKYLEMLKELGQGESTKYVLPMELTNLVRPLIKVLSEKATEKAIQSGGEEISDALRASGTDSDSQQSSNISKLDWPGS
jgi:regulator of protease activity HflC (stomatin/prohibitin superfamily)